MAALEKGQRELNAEQVQLKTIDKRKKFEMHNISSEQVALEKLAKFSQFAMAQRKKWADVREPKFAELELALKRKTATGAVLRDMNDQLHAMENAHAK